MQSNKLTIFIRRPVADVFVFTVDPNNTPKWIESIVEEMTNEWPVKTGSVYRNKNAAGTWSQYSVKAIEDRRMFELVSADENYHVRYTYAALGDTASEMEYLEWMDAGDLPDPFTQYTLNRLKTILESV